MSLITESSSHWQSKSKFFRNLLEWLRGQAKQALLLGNTDRAEERLTAIEGWLRTIEYLGSRERLELLLAEDQKALATSMQPYVM